MKEVQGKVTNADNVVSTRVVRVLGVCKCYAISKNKGVKAPYTLHFEQDIDTAANGRGAILKGSGYAVTQNHRKTALQSFTKERLNELKLTNLVEAADVAGPGVIVNLPKPMNASVLFDGYDVNISITETTEKPNANAQPKRAGEDGPILRIGDMEIYTERFLVAGDPTFDFLQHGKPTAEEVKEAEDEAAAKKAAKSF